MSSVHITDPDGLHRICLSFTLLLTCSPSRSLVLPGGLVFSGTSPAPFLSCDPPHRLYIQEVKTLFVLMACFSLQLVCALHLGLHTHSFHGCSLHFVDEENHYQYISCMINKLLFCLCCSTEQVRHKCDEVQNNLVLTTCL